MPIEPAAPTFPRSESLARFFRMPPASLVALPEVAALLGTSIPTFRAMLRDEGTLPPDGPIPWTEAASYVFDAWPRAQLMDALGPDAASIFPRDFHLARVDWRIPIFILRAMEHQAAASARGVADYVADLLYNEIQPATLGAFRDDSEFLRAFHYPVID